MKIVLYQPQIPQNTGNIVRTCAVAGADLILGKPLGFSTSDRWLKRSGLDYWEGVYVEEVDQLDQWLEALSCPFYFFSSKAAQRYDQLHYTPHDCLIFGSEDKGLPSEWHRRWQNRFATIPMMPDQRCLNLATSVGIVLYEAWRQQRFFNAERN